VLLSIVLILFVTARLFGRRSTRRGLFRTLADTTMGSLRRLHS
jgi:hypothetical protein